MKPSFNLSIIKHTSVSGDSINNLLTLFHLVEKEGTYAGTVFQNERALYDFMVICGKEEKNELLHIDLSLFDVLYSHSKKQAHYKHPVFHIKTSGVLLFFVSGIHKNLSVKIRNIKNEKEIEFDSGHLTKSDKAAFRLFRFGQYELANKLKKQKVKIEVVRKSDDIDSKTSGIPLILKFSSKGFQKANIKLQTGQLLVIDSDSNLSVDLRMKDTKRSF